MQSAKEKIVIYVKQSCPYCQSAKKLLDEKGIQYEEIDVIKNPDLFNNIKSKYSVRTVPQIFIADQDGNYVDHIAGYSELIKPENEKKLDDMLNHNDGQTNVMFHTENNIIEDEGCAISHDDLI